MERSITHDRSAAGVEAHTACHAVKAATRIYSTPINVTARTICSLPPVYSVFIGIPTIRIHTRHAARGKQHVQHAHHE